jgi:hypothetical protein
MDEGARLLSLIERSSNDPAVMQELYVYTYRVEYLPIFDRILPSCHSSRQAMHLCLLILRDLITNRGCLLSIEELQVHISILIDVGCALADLIASDIPVGNMYAGALAISYRLSCELKSPYQFVQLFDFVKLSNAHQSVMLNVMYWILQVMKMPLRHITIPQQRDLEKQFCRICIRDFIEGTLQALSGNSHPMTDLLLQLFRDCFLFGVPGGIQKMVFAPSQIPNTLYVPARAASIIEILFRAFRSIDNAVSTHAMEALLCYCSIGSRTWPPKIIPFLDLWMLVADAMFEPEVVSPNSEAVAMFLRKLASAEPPHFPSAPLAAFIHRADAENYLERIISFSKTVPP